MPPDHGSVNATPRPDPTYSPKVRKIIDSMICAADIVPVEMVWLWFPLIPAGSLTLLEGHPGLGKSTIACALAADLSQGRPLPGDTPRGTKKVLMLSTEDEAGVVMLQRLQAHDADMKNIHISNQGFSLDADGMSALAAMMRKVDATVLFVDPLVSYIGGKVDMYRANETRAALEPLVDLARETRCTVIMVRHLRKNTDGDKRMAGYGSIDFYGQARSVLQVEEDGATLLVNNIKNNYAKHGTRIIYSIQDTKITWGRYYKPGEGLKVSHTSRRQHESREWWIKQLSGGSKSSHELEDRAISDGLQWETLRRHARGLAYSYKDKTKHGAWFWALEKHAVAPDPGPPTEDTPFDPGVMASAIKFQMAQKTRREQ